MDYQEAAYGDEAWHHDNTRHQFYYYDEDSSTLSSSWHQRLLQYGKEKTSGYRMDYSVLSVAVMTLGLIMVVEVFIHNLDHAAHGRPYFQAVLDNIYSERKKNLAGVTDRSR